MHDSCRVVAFFVLFVALGLMRFGACLFGLAVAHAPCHIRTWMPSMNDVREKQKKKENFARNVRGFLGAGIRQIRIHWRVQAAVAGRQKGWAGKSKRIGLPEENGKGKRKMSRKRKTSTEAEEAVIEKKKMETDAQRAAAVRLEHVVPPAKKKRKTTTDTSGGAPEDTRGPRHGREGPAGMEGRALQRSPSFEEPPVELAPTPPSTFSGARML